MVKIMRVRNVALFFVICTLVLGASPFAVRAATSRSTVYRTAFVGFPTIPYTLLISQTALRAGDTPTFQVGVHSPYGNPPTVSVDLSQLGIPSPTTTPAGIGSPNYNMDSYYNFGPFTIGPNVPDGFKTIFVTATDAVGDIATTTARIIVDNIKPIVTVSDITFSTTSPKGGDYMYLSGKLDGTGSAVNASRVTMSLTDATGNPVVSNVVGGSTFGFNPLGLNTMLARSADGSFSHVPIQLVDFGDTGWIPRAVNFNIDITAYDEAGNIANGNLTVLIPKPPPPDPCASGGCVSNVLFLPGIEASRLYYRGALGIEHQVWEPDYHTDIPYLAMNADGTSKYPLYTKDIIDIVQAHNPLVGTIASIFGKNLETYGGFEHFMDGLVTAHTIKEWRAYPYDWRYDVRDIVDNGTPTEMQDGSVQQVYLADVLRDMASSSPTKRVTIVAHSNGGLLAKALAAKLGADAPKYIDRIIMVGTPQWGTPTDIGTMLHGDDGTNLFGIITSGSDVRAAAETMPGTYGLLPSSAYFAYVSDPTVTFDTGGLLSGKFAANLGPALTSFSALASFLTDSAGLDAQAGSPADLRTPLALSSALVDKAVATHNALDSWTPPAGITVTAIAGWGQDTVKTLTYTTVSKVVCTNLITTSACADTPALQHTPVTTQDGDATVVSLSAVGNTSNSLYFNALDFVHSEKKNIEHQNLTSAQPVQNVIADLLQNKDTSAEQYISDTKPPNDTNAIKLRISSHSPVNMVVTDAAGNQSGVLPIPGTDFSGAKRDIPDSSVQVVDDEEYISVPQSGTYQVAASGYASGSATLTIETVNGDVASTTASFTDIPTTASSTVTFSVANGTPTAPAVDINGDGKIDFTAVSAAPGADPLAYVRYMESVIGAMPLSRGEKQELGKKLGEMELQLTPAQRVSDDRGDKGKKDKKEKDDGEDRYALDRQKSLVGMQLDILSRNIEQQVALSIRRKESHERDSQKGISPAQAEIILDMINTLKALLI